MKTWSEMNSEDSKKSRDCWAPWEFRTKNSSLPSRTQQKKIWFRWYSQGVSALKASWLDMETLIQWKEPPAFLPLRNFPPSPPLLLLLFLSKTSCCVVSLDSRRNPQSLAPEVEAMNFWLQLDLKCWGLVTTWINKVLGCLREILEGTTLRSLQWANSWIQEN